MALIPDPVWNCQTISPVSASTAMNSPVSLPVNSRPPPVASIADQIWKSISAVHLLERICSQQLAISAVDHVEEAIAVELHDHLALLAADIDVGVDQFPAGVVIVGIIGRELVVPYDLTGRRSHRQYR